MSQENVEMVHRANEAFNRGDIDGGRRSDPDCRYTAVGNSRPYGVFHGHEGSRSSSAGCEASSADARAEDR